MIPALIAALSFAFALQARDTATISDRPSCVACTLRIQQAGLVGRGSADSISPIAGARTMVVSSKGGGILLLQERSPNRVVFSYDSRGVLTGTIGRAGQGPGELRFPIAFASNSARDSIYIFDEPSRQMAVLDLNGRIGRSVRLPMVAYDALVLPDGRIVVAANLGTRSTADPTIHLLAPNGTIERSFHPLRSTLRDVPPGPLPYLLALNPKGGFVVFDMRFLTFTMYDNRGNVQKILRRSAAWQNSGRLPLDTIKPRGSLEQSYTISLRPPSRPRAIHMDSAGRIWLLAALEHPSWAQGGREWKPQGSSPAYLETFWVGHVEVIDPVTSSLLHARQLPFIPDRFTGDGLVVRSRDDGFGSLQLELFRLELIK